jgi:2-dehydro-3-deoxygluconokinase
MANQTIIGFGEILLRLSVPGRGLLVQANRFDAHVGGAEANVCVGLARLGHEVRMVSVLPNNGLGDMARAALRSTGVDLSLVRKGEGRMGLYFLEPGASLRPSRIIYDRAASAFALTSPASFDWPELLAGGSVLHVSGVTAALGPAGSEAALAALKAAKSAGVMTSFDANYRAQLWEAWNPDPAHTLRALVEQADLLFGNHRDISLLLDQPFSGDGPERRREAAEAAFAVFPNLKRIASTSRHIEHVDCHRIAARLDTRQHHYQTEELEVAGIVDRIGAGDAFAAGVLHGLVEGAGEAQAVKDGLALAVLKHSQPGDAALFTAADLAAFDAGSLDVRR